MKIFIWIIVILYSKVAFGQPSFLSKINSDTTCLALNIFFESRGEKDDAAKIAIGLVTLNRYNQNLNLSICDVVFMPSNLPTEKPLACQFSWTCDPNLNHRKKLRREEDAYIKSYLLARELLRGKYHYDITLGSDHYYNCDTIPFPDSFYGLHKTVKIGSHCFYSSTDIHTRY